MRLAVCQQHGYTGSSRHALVVAGDAHNRCQITVPVPGVTVTKTVGNSDLVNVQFDHNLSSDR